MLWRARAAFIPPKDDLRILHRSERARRDCRIGGYPCSSQPCARPRCRLLPPLRYRLSRSSRRKPITLQLPGRAHLVRRPDPKDAGPDLVGAAIRAIATPTTTTRVEAGAGARGKAAEVTTKNAARVAG